jgi:hypothetical protein
MRLKIFHNKKALLYGGAFLLVENIIYLLVFTNLLEMCHLAQEYHLIVLGPKFGV